VHEVDVEGGDGGGQGEAFVVVVGFGQGEQGFFGVEPGFGGKNPAAGSGQGRGAVNARVAGGGPGQVGDGVGGVVASVVGVEQVITGFVGPGDEVGGGGNQVVDEDAGVFDAYRRSVAGTAPMARISSSLARRNLPTRASSLASLRALSPRMMRKRKLEGAILDNSLFDFEIR
jgi:hypothetical protein